MMLLRLSLSFAFGACLLAQETSRQATLTTFDVNGNRVEGPTYVMTEAPTGGKREEMIRSINGRLVPLQSTEDKVLQQDARSKTVERVMRKYDATGNPGPPEIQRIEEHKNPDGSSTLITTTYRSDINGRPQLAERTTTQQRKSAGTETTTTVERATLNGSLEQIERIASVERPAGSGSRADTTIYRKDVSGNYYPAVQEVKVTTKSGNEETADTTRYEVVGSSLKLEPAQRQVAKTTTKPDGSQIEEVDVYSRFAANHTADVNAGAPTLQEQILRERVPAPGNKMIETTSVRAHLPSDATRFGNFEKVAQTILTGTDTSGHTVKNIETSVGRRDPNGQIIVQEQTTERVVAPAPPPPPPAPAKQ